MTTRPDLLFVLSNGFSTRMVLQSALVPKLQAKGLRVAVLSPSAGDTHFKALCTRHGIEAIACPDVTGKVLGLYSDARRYLFEDFQANASLRAKHQFEVHAPSIHPVLRARAHAGNALNALVTRAPSVQRRLGDVEHLAIRSGSYRALLAGLAPRVLVSTYPVNWVEIFALREAERLGIRTVGQLLSWDNITCKGRFAAVPERFISWGPIMTRELAEFYGVDEESVEETGVAHFDMHAHPPDEAARDTALRKLGLDPARPYLFFGMSASFFAPHEIDIAAWLARRVREGRYGDGLQLIVRPHPQSIRGRMADANIVAKLEGMAGGGVVIDVPDVVSDRVDMADAEMPRLASLLRGAAITFNSGSTLCIDALIHDRPVVMTPFDADARLPWWRSARRIEEFPHIVKLLSYGAITVTRSFTDLDEAVRDYLAHPGLKREERARALEAECGRVDGMACDRIASALERLVGAG